MVTAQELEDDNEYEDIKEDVRLECSDHGRVTNIVIPRMKEAYSSQVVGYIYVEFLESSMARAAALILNGRKFADKTVVVEYVSN